MRHLIGNSLREFDKDRIPSNREVLKRYLHFKDNGRLDDLSARIKTVAEIIQICEYLEIAPVAERSLHRSIKKLWLDLQKANKSKSRPSSAALNRLHSSWNETFRAACDPNAGMRKRRKEREEAFEKRKQREILRRETETTIFYDDQLMNELIGEDIPELVSDLCNNDDPDFKASVKTKVKVLGKSTLASLDRAGISSKSSFRILASVMAELDFDLLNCTLSYSTIWRQRKLHQAQAELESRAFLDKIEHRHLTLHFDGIRLFDSSLKKFVEHLVIVVSKGNNFEHLISVNRINSASGRAIANTIIAELDKFSTLIRKISLICHDTPAVNTGRFVGVVPLLINHFKGQKILFNAPCRHHIHELIASSVYVTLFGKPSGPAVPLFVKFRGVFDSLDLSQPKEYDYFIDGEDLIIDFIDNQLKLNHRRSDYVQFLELARMFIRSDTLYSIKRPGADSQARWMSKFIYSFKIYLFRDQLRTLKFDCSFSKLRDFCLFGVQIYIKSWFEAELSCHCVLNDLTLYKSLLVYPQLTIREAAVKSFSRHLDYLNAPLSTFVLFDDRVNLSDRRKMVENLNSDRPTEINESTQVYNLISDGNLRFLNSLDLNLEFLSIDVSQ